MKNTTKKSHELLDKAILKKFFNVYPELKDDTNKEWLKLLRQLRTYTAEAQTKLNNNDPKLLLLLEGRVRVYQLAPDGRECTLCRNAPGDISIISLSAVIKNQPSYAHAVVEKKLLALEFPAKEFMLAMDINQAFRLLILNGMADSFNNIIDTFQQTVFSRLEERMLCLLSRLFYNTSSDTLQITHQEIAHEIGTTREVISRLLKQMEQDGKIQLSRGKITCTDKNQLSSSVSQSLCTTSI